MSANNGIAHIRLNRPESSSGLDVGLLKAVYEALMHCHGDKRVRGVILSGEGAHFCAGGDVKTFASKGEALPDYIREATAYLPIVVGAMMQLHAVIEKRRPQFEGK